MFFRERWANLRPSEKQKNFKGVVGNDNRTASGKGVIMKIREFTPKIAKSQYFKFIDYRTGKRLYRGLIANIDTALLDYDIFLVHTVMG